MDREKNRGKTTQSSEENERDLYLDRREKNRLAAHKCRQKREKQIQGLKQQNQELEQDNKKLADEKRELKKQALIHKRLVEEHCEKGCKIPDELMEFWNDMNKTMTEESSSDEDSDGENKLPDVGVFDEMHAPPRSPPNATEAAQQLHASLPDNAGHQFEVPTTISGLFSGKPLDALHPTRSRSNSSSKSILPAPVPPAQVRLRRASTSTPGDFLTSQATADLPGPLTPVSIRSTKVVQMQVDITDTPSNAVNNIPRTLSNIYCFNGNVSAMVVKSPDTMQVQTTSALPVTQPMSEMGTRCPLPDGPIKTVGQVSETATMEYENGAPELPVANEAANHQNLLSFNSFLDSVEGYTFSEELFSNAKIIESRNDNIQGWEVARTNGGKQFQSQSQSEPTVLFDAMASSQASPSLLQQIKTSLCSLARQAAETKAETGVIFAGQNITWSNEMLASQVEEQSKSSTNQFQSNHKHSVIASRQVGSQNETSSSRVRQEGYDQWSGVNLGISANNPIKATVLSNEQLFILKQKQTLGQKLPSGCSPARNKSATSHQQDVQLPQQVTWTSVGTNEANSKEDNNASEVFVHLYNTKTQTGAHLVAQKKTVAVNELSSREVTDYKSTVSQSRLNIPHSGLLNVPHKRTTHPFVPNTVTSHNASTISTQILSNISSDQFAQHSPFKIANGSSRDEHGRLAAATNNDIYISAPPCNSPSQQHVSQITGANKTVKFFFPNVASSNNSVYNSTPTRLNTKSGHICTQINYPISTNRHTPKASNDASYMCTSSADNTSMQSDVQNHNTTTSAMTSGGQQYIIDTRLALPAALFSREVQVSKVINGHPRNTETSCSSTDTADKVSINTTSETLLQPTMAISDINSPNVMVPEDGLLMSVTDVTQDTYEHRISVPEDIDYLSESPQAQFSF